MSLIQISSLALKLLGIYAIIQALPTLGTFPSMFAFADGDKGYMFLGSILPFILLFGAGVFLILSSNKLASKMMVGDEINIPTTQLTGRNVQTIAFSILGIAMIAWAIPEFSKIFANIQLLKNAGDEFPRKSIGIGTQVYAIGLSIQCVVGLLLFFGAKGLSSIWFFLQKTRPMSKTDT
jgi:hypothetical protein